MTFTSWFYFTNPIGCTYSFTFKISFFAAVKQYFFMYNKVTRISVRHIRLNDT